MLDPRRLRLLVQLESLQTVRAVAAAASMSPSAVSQQLAVLEREAGGALLERHGRNVALTGAGRRLASHARGILAGIAAAEDDLRALRDEPAGVVGVAAFTSAMQAFGIAAAAQVRAAHPGVVVRLDELGPAACVTALDRGDADLAVVGDFGDGTLERTPNLAAVPLAVDELLAILPAGHPAGDRERGVRLEDLAAEPWLLDGTELEHHLVRRCRREGFEPRLVARLFSHEALLHAVGAGLGVTVLPAFALGSRDGLLVRPLDPPAGRELHVLHRPDALDRRAVAVVLEALVAASGGDGAGAVDDDV